MILKPKNWSKFQHYRDRCPPWIKLHRDILNDRVFASLPIASKALAPLLWLLASESKDGSFDAAIDELAFRLHIASKDIEQGLKPLIDNVILITFLPLCLYAVHCIAIYDFMQDWYFNCASWNIPVLVILHNHLSRNNIIFFSSAK